MRVTQAGGGDLTGVAAIGAGGTGTFRIDTAPGCWADYRPMAEFKARGGHEDDE